MSDLATLAIKVDSTGVTAASKHLDELTGKAQKVEGATKKVETATQSAGAKFAAMAGTVMKLTAAFAALAAVQRGWGLMAEAAKYEQQVRALNNLAASYNSNGNKIIADLKRISDGTINTITLVEKAGTAMMLGIAPEKISKLMEIARATARMTGQEVSTAFDNIAMAVGRQSKMILDNLGIIVSVESANRTYAVQLKKTADNLSDTEKKAAFLNATIAAGEDLIARMGQQSDTTKDKMDRLKASVDNARLMISQGLIRVVLGATGAFQWLAAGVMTVIAIIPKLLEYMARANAKIYEWTGQTERMKASLSEAASLKKGYEDMLGAAGELAGKAADNFSAMVSSTEDMAGAINRAIPPIDGVTDTLDAAAKAAQKLREEAEKINETLGNDIKMSGLDELDKKLFEIQIKYEKLAKNPLVDKGLLSTARGNEESSARWEARSQELKKEAELTQEITKAEEELIKTIQDGYDATMAGIQKQYDADGQLLRDKLELYKDLTGFEDEYRQVQLDWIERIKNEEIKATGDVAAAEKKAAKERAQIEYNLFKTKTDYIADGFGQLQSAFSDIASVYEKGSDAARQWETAAKAMEIAQEAVAVVQAVGAIATQGLGDPYTAFARIAAMAATMGSLLATIGKSVGGGSFATASAPAMGNSTVLGAAYGTESESIANSLEILKDTYDLENSKLTKIYDELRDLNNNITGLVSGIIRAGGSFDGMTIENDAVAATKAREIFMGVDVIRTLHKWGGELLGIKNLEIWADPISYIVNNLLGDLVQSVVTGIFGGEKTVATIGAGYKIGGSSIKDIMSGGVNTQQYQTILSKTSGGWFHDDEVFIGTIYRKVDAEVANLFNKVFQNLGGTLVGLAEQLGTDIEDALAYKFKDIKLNLMGKDGEGISKAISEALSAAGDNAAKALFGEMISRYQQVNEGMLETAVRLVTDKESVLAVLRLTNQSFTGTTSKLIEFSESLISVAGNLEELTDAFQTYYDAFFSDAEKQADTKRALSAALGMYGFDLPGSRSGYRELVESLNLTTEAGQAAYVALMQMSQSADEYYKYLEQAKGNIKPENYATELEYKRAMAGFSDGGLSYGPESGYEAKLHGTELIISQKKGVPAKVQGMNTGELVTEIRALRSEVGQGNFYSKANADKIVKLLDRWEAIGPQPART
jgi:hypothetical protein